LNSIIIETNTFIVILFLVFAMK